MVEPPGALRSVRSAGRTGAGREAAVLRVLVGVAVVLLGIWVLMGLLGWIVKGLFWLVLAGIVVLVGSALVGSGRGRT